jgi:hypothetical protein
MKLKIKKEIFQGVRGAWKCPTSEILSDSGILEIPYAFYSQRRSMSNDLSPT